MSYIQHTATLMIPDGSVESNVLSSRFYSDAALISLSAVGTIPGGGITYTIMVHTNHDAVVGDSGWVTYQENGSDASLPLTGKARSYFGLLGFSAFYILASSNVGADAVWNVSRLATI